MAEYIEREKLLKKFCNHCYFDVSAKDCAEDCFDVKIIKSIPTADVQPIVRCINCKNYKGLACCKLIGDCGGTNWFCGWGEPKEET